MTDTSKLRATPETDAATWWEGDEFLCGSKRELMTPMVSRTLERQRDELVKALREWRGTELDSMDDEFEPWMESFTSRVDALLATIDGEPK